MNQAQADALTSYNEDMNRQTRQALRGALFLLLKDKTLEKISVTELVARAGVSRTAFYRNYKTKNDVLKEFTNDIIEGIAGSIMNPRYRGNHYLWYLDTLTYIYENRSYAEDIIKADVSFAEVTGVRSVLDRVIPAKDRETWYIYLAIEGGLMNIISSWISEGFKESPMELASYCERVLPKMYF